LVPGLLRFGGVGMDLQLLDSAHYLVCKHSMAARQRCHQRFRPGTTYAKGSCTESSVDDLGTCRGVVLSRAATILRSIETQPSTGRFVRFDEQPSFGPLGSNPWIFSKSQHLRVLAGGGHTHGQRVVPTIRAGVRWSRRSWRTCVFWL
jgi:hypothetical protein